MDERKEGRKSHDASQGKSFLEVKIECFGKSMLVHGTEVN